MPRARAHGSTVRPHYNDEEDYTTNIICYCHEHDPEIEAELPLRLSEFCDCNVFARWMCVRCFARQQQEIEDYYDRHTDYHCHSDEIPGVTNHYKILKVGEFEDLAFWCPCGKRAPSDGDIRCQWCKRRHRTRDYLSPSFPIGTDASVQRVLDLSWEPPRNYIPFFDDDPVYPRVPRLDEPPQNQILGYPRLAYDGPVWGEYANAAESGGAAEDYVARTWPNMPRGRVTRRLGYYNPTREPDESVRS